MGCICTSPKEKAKKKGSNQVILESEGNLRVHTTKSLKFVGKPTKCPKSNQGIILKQLPNIRLRMGSFYLIKEGSEGGEAISSCLISGNKRLQEFYDKQKESHGGYSSNNFFKKKDEGSSIEMEIASEDDVRLDRDQMAKFLGLDEGSVDNESAQYSENIPQSGKQSEDSSSQYLENMTPMHERIYMVSEVEIVEEDMENDEDDMESECGVQKKMTATTANVDSEYQSKISGLSRFGEKTASKRDESEQKKKFNVSVTYPQKVVNKG